MIPLSNRNKATGNKALQLNFGWRYDATDVKWTSQAQFKWQMVSHAVGSTVTSSLSSRTELATFRFVSMRCAQTCQASATFLYTANNVNERNLSARDTVNINKFIVKLVSETIFDFVLLSFLNRQILFWLFSTMFLFSLFNDIITTPAICLVCKQFYAGFVQMWNENFAEKIFFLCPVNV